MISYLAQANAAEPASFVMLHKVAKDLKVDDASAEAAMRLAATEGWLLAEGISLFRVSLTPAGLAVCQPR